MRRGCKPEFVVKESGFKEIWLLPKQFLQNKRKQPAQVSFELKKDKCFLMKESERKKIV